MKKKFIGVLPLVALLLSSCGGQTAKQESVPPIGFRAENYFHDSTNVRNGETFPGLMTRLGLSRSDAATLTSRLDTVFNPRRMRAGARVDSYYSVTDSSRVLEYVVYNHSKINKTVFKCADSLALWNYRRPTQTDPRYIDITISNSLWSDLLAAGAGEAETAALVDQLSEIYAWTVNFFTLQDGDRFQVVYPVVSSEGEFMYTGDVSCARFSRGGDEIYAIRFDHDGLSDKYYDASGKNLRKAFLKAPLKYKRVSSTFTYARKHPITGRVRPHTGVDYAAPAGTPVLALGDGTVISAGWTTNGGGNVIKIRHNSTYTTGYLHLRGFAKGIKKGAKVSQGQVIGYVGSTGASTGPHLDFRVWKNSQPIDPLHMASPAADPLPKKYLPELDSLHTVYKAVFDTGKLQ